MISYLIFVVDDEPTIRDGIKTVLAGTYGVRVFATAEEALKHMEMHNPDLVLLDIGLPGMNGIEALRRIKAASPGVQVVMITAYEDVQTVIAAMKMGAFDYIVKPLNMDELRVTIENALEAIRLRKEVQALQERTLREQHPFFIAESDTIQDVMAFVGRVAASPDTPVLIQGETGTGKELVAGAIHYRSPNFRGPLVTMNCASIPRDLLESELFGYEKGAFTGASATGKKGMIEEAAGGTLFLDEVGDLSQEAQAKLLRFLEEGEFYRVGGTRKMKVGTRVVSATNKDVDTMISEGRFRQDLYFRLGVIRVRVPSLSERREDILPLAKHFLMLFNEKFGKIFTGFSQDAEEVLLTHAWSGNVRELRNAVERAVLVGGDSVLSVEDLGLEARPSGADGGTRIFPAIPREGIHLDAVVRDMEKHYIEEAYRWTGGNESEAARLLGLNHHTFRYRRKKYSV